MASVPMSEDASSKSTLVDMSSQGLLYRSHHMVKVGGVHRFFINYIPQEGVSKLDSIFVKIKNVELLPLRAAFLVGPFILYCDIKPIDFDHNKKCFITADQPIYNPNLSAGQSIVTELSTHTIKDKYVWVVDVVSQMIFSSTADIHFEVMIGTNTASLHRHNFADRFGTFSTSIYVQHQDTLDLWNQPPPRKAKDPVHLVVLTHGLHSNATADMFYIKEQIESISAKNKDENIVVRCYPGNVCKTERGVKYLGRRLAEHIVNECVTPDLNIKKISFIAHSLGGLVQTFAISYINHNYPDFFTNIKPINFIAMASPFLGVSNENPAFVKIALSAGIVGKTGQDLGLQGIKPLLMLLPSKPTRKILRKFKRRTIYANALHDGIVPLRTGAILYLDWKGLSKVHDVLQADKNNSSNGGTHSPQGGTESSAESGNVEAIPQDQSSIGGQKDNSFQSQIKNKVLSPLQSVISLMVPNLNSRERGKRYQRYQTVDKSSNDPGGDTADLENEINPLPKSSMISSASAVLLPPLPPLKYLVDPSSRPKAILHDKLYTPDSIPKIARKSTTFLDNIDPVKRQRALEEEIARRWHKGLTWRKVIVNLLPDAHNNIIVRRKFANAYGWPVVEHMVENHFGSKVSDYDEMQKKAKVGTQDQYEEEADDSEDDEDEDETFDDDNRNEDIDDEIDSNNKESNGKSPTHPKESHKSYEELKDKDNSDKLADILEFQRSKFLKQQQNGSQATETTLVAEHEYSGSNRTRRNKTKAESVQKIVSKTQSQEPTSIGNMNGSPTIDRDFDIHGYESDSTTLSSCDESDELELLRSVKSAENYDGPTGTLSNMQEVVNDRIDSWKQNLYFGDFAKAIGGLVQDAQEDPVELSKADTNALKSGYKGSYLGMKNGDDASDLAQEDEVSDYNAGPISSYDEQAFYNHLY